MRKTPDHYMNVAKHSVILLRSGTIIKRSKSRSASISRCSTIVNEITCFYRSIIRFASDLGSIINFTQAYNAFLRPVFQSRKRRNDNLYLSWCVFLYNSKSWLFLLANVLKKVEKNLSRRGTDLAGHSLVVPIF